MPNKSICLRYFTAQDEGGNKCTRGKVLIQRKNSGWTYLFNHMTSRHPEWDRPENQSKITSLSLSPSDNLFAWIEWACKGLKLFNFVEDPLTRKYTNLKPITTKTLQKYMDLLYRKVELTIVNILPSKFTVVMYGWTKGSTHYLANRTSC